MFDFPYFITMLPDIWEAFKETVVMIGIALSISIIIGLPFGVLLFVTDKGLFWENRFVKNIFGFAVNLVRSIPFIILLVALFPLTKILVGTTIGPIAASVSLSVAAIPYFARLVESSLRDIDKGVIEATIAVGATPDDYQRCVATRGKINNYSRDYSNGYQFGRILCHGRYNRQGRYWRFSDSFGYYRYDNTIMISTVVILIIFVQLIQLIGEQFAKSLDKR